MKKLKAGGKQRIRNAPVQGAGHLIKRGGAEMCKRIRGHKVQKGSQQCDIFREILPLIFRTCSVAVFLRFTVHQILVVDNNTHL